MTFLKCLLSPSIIFVVYIIDLTYLGKLKNGATTSQLFLQILIVEVYCLPHFLSILSKADEASYSLTALYTNLKLLINSFESLYETYLKYSYLMDIHFCITELGNLAAIAFLKTFNPSALLVYF